MRSEKIKACQEEWRTSDAAAEIQHREGHSLGARRADQTSISVDMPAVDALKQQDRWKSMVEPGQLPGELHARRATTTDQPRLWLVIHVRIIGVRECRHGTGNFVRRASVEATSVVGDRARVRRLRRIPSLRISGRPAQTAAALAGACGQAASHPRIGGTGVPAPGLSEQASNYVSMTDIACSQSESISALAARQPNTAAARAEKLGVMRSNTWSARLARQPPTDPEDFPRSTARGGAWTAAGGGHPSLGVNAPTGSASHQSCASHDEAAIGGHYSNSPD